MVKLDNTPSLKRKTGIGLNESLNYFDFPELPKFEKPMKYKQSAFGVNSQMYPMPRASQKEVSPGAASASLPSLGTGSEYVQAGTQIAGTGFEIAGMFNSSNFGKSSNYGAEGRAIGAATGAATLGTLGAVFLGPTGASLGTSLGAALGGWTGQAIGASNQNTDFIANQKKTNELSFIDKLKNSTVYAGPKYENGGVIPVENLPEVTYEKKGIILKGLRHDKTGKSGKGNPVKTATGSIPYEFEAGELLLDSPTSRLVLDTLKNPSSKSLITLGKAIRDAVRK